MKRLLVHAMGWGSFMAQLKITDWEGKDRRLQGMGTMSVIWWLFATGLDQRLIDPGIRGRQGSSGDYHLLTDSTRYHMFEWMNKYSILDIAHDC